MEPSDSSAATARRVTDIDFKGMKHMKTLSIFTLLVLGGLVAQTQAGDHGCCQCCPNCGCQQVRKVCRLVCEMRDQVTFEYDMDCNDFCPMGKSDKCGTRCVPDCSKWCGYRKEIIWQPHCSCHPRTIRTLVKIPVIKQVPVYHCEVDRICCGCGCNCGCCGAATPSQQQAAIEKAEARGILPVSAEEEITVPLDETKTAEAAPAAVEPAAPKTASLGLFRFFKGN